MAVIWGILRETTRWWCWILNKQEPDHEFNFPSIGQSLGTDFQALNAEQSSNERGADHNQSYDVQRRQGKAGQCQICGGMHSITVHNGHLDTSLHTIFHMCHRSATCRTLQTERGSLKKLLPRSSEDLLSKAVFQAKIYIGDAGWSIDNRQSETQRAFGLKKICFLAIG